MGLQLNGLSTASGDISRTVPPGAYDVAVSKVELVETKGENGKHKMPMIKIQFRIQSGEHDGKSVFDQIVVPNSQMKEFVNTHNLNRIKKICIASGTPAVDDFDPKEWEGKQLKIIVNERTSKLDPSQKNNSVEDYLPCT